MLPYVSVPFEYLHGLLGADVDELKLIGSFLLSYPLASILKRLPADKPQLKNIFIISVSLFYLVGLFDLWDALRTIIISSAAAYLIASFVSGPLMPWLGFVFIMGHMFINHIYRHYDTNVSAVDLTYPQMVLVMKLTSFCWNVHDGQLDPSTLDAHQKDRALKKLPNLLDFSAYVLFFPALMIGPAFDYAEYARWLDLSMFDPPQTAGKPAPSRKNRKLPSSGLNALFKAGFGLVMLLGFLNLSAMYPADLLLSDDYLTYSFLRRIWLMHMVGFSARVKYYSVWSLTEGSCILTGIGYSGIDASTGRARWDRLTNVEPFGIELAQNTRAYLASWNMNTNNWLRNCVYLRVTPRGAKPGFRASLATFTTSALWHGFEPGYYMSFVLAAFLQTAAKNCRRLVRPLFLRSDGTPLPSKRAYDLTTLVVTQLAFTFAVMPFLLLSWERSTTAWARVYYYDIVGVVVMLAAFSGPSPVRKLLKARVDGRAKASKKAENEAAAAAATVATGANVNATSGARPAQKPPVAHLPDDPGEDLDEVLDEVKAEVELRRRQGTSVKQGLQEVVQEKLGKPKAGSAKGARVNGRSS